LRDKLAVVGLGYVGLPLVSEALQANFLVNGIDVNINKINDFRSGTINVEGVNTSIILGALKDFKFAVTTDFSVVSQADTVVICVPTPLTSDHKPDLSFIESAVIQLSAHIQKGVLIILESTVGPGTVRNFVLPLLEKHSSLTKDEFYLVYSPERIDPLNKFWSIKNTPKLISGLTFESCNLAKDFYSKFINEIVICDSLEVAETAKLLENSFRFINISFINEIMTICHKLGIDTEKVIRAASTKPYGFMPFYPSLGVGGHCIPVDPIYLAHKAESVGTPSRFITLADTVNREMVDYFVQRAEQIVGILTKKKILVIGVSYKPNISDIRESASRLLIAKLRAKGAVVSWHDDLVVEMDNERSTHLSDNFDLVILAIHHDYLDLTKVGSVPILNTHGSNS
jgi:UDP-N-acetyl-D-glucosamine dehydrogenase